MDIVSNVGYQKLLRFTTSKGDLYFDIIGNRASGHMTMSTPTVIATPISGGNLPSTIWDGNWHCIEMQIGLSNSTYKLWLDGNLYYSDTSVNYGPVVGATFSNLMQHFPLGNRSGNPMSSYQSSWQAWEVDDIVIANTYIGPVGGGTPPAGPTPPAPPLSLIVQ
jgi:hypothetical protein